MNYNSLEVDQLNHRDVSISVIRLFAMLLIIGCHMTSFYHLEVSRWLNVGVQLFFVISGFLYGSKDILSPIAFIIKAFRKILIPYWFFLILAICSYIVFCPSSLDLSSVVRAFFCAGTIDGLGHLWFVGYILFCYLLVPYLYWLKKYLSAFSIKKSVLIYCSLCLIIQLLAYIFNSYFEPDRVSCFIIGFFLADMFSRFSSKGISYLKWFVIILAVLMSISEIVLKYHFRVEFAGWQDIAFKAFCRYSHMFLGLAIFLFLYGKFSLFNYSLLLKGSDRFSYPIYLVHQLFILSPLSLMTVSNSVILNISLVLIIILLVGIVLGVLSERIVKKFELSRS